MEVVATIRLPSLSSFLPFSSSSSPAAASTLNSASSCGREKPKAWDFSRSLAGDSSWRRLGSHATERRESDSRGISLFTDCNSQIHGR